MIPIWAKNGTGKYRVFPQDQLMIFEDGKLGVSFHIPKTPNWPAIFLLSEWGHLFDYDKDNWRYLLKKQLTNE